MTRPLNDHFIAYEGHEWSLIERPGLELPARLPGFEPAPWTGDTYGPPRRRSLELDGDGRVRLAKVTDYGWRIDDRGERVRVPGGAPWETSGASAVVLDVDVPLTATGRWILARDVRPGISMHSWLPTPRDFLHVRVIDLVDGRVVRVRTWEEHQRRESRAIYAVTGLIVALLAAIAAAAVVWSTR